MLENLAGGLRTLMCGVFLYAFGGYIHKYNPFEKIRVCFLMIITVMIYAIIYISYYNYIASSIKSYLINVTLKEARGENADDFIQTIIGFGNYEIVPIILAVVLFEIFRRIHIPNNRAINLFGASTFMIYLFHDNAFWYEIWKERNWIEILYNTPFVFCWKLFQWSLFMFVIGIGVYMIYLMLSRIIIKCAVETVNHN